MIKKQLLLLTTLFLGAFLHAQSAIYVQPSELQYDSKSHLTNYRNTQKPFTGYEYTLFYYRKDTMQLRYFKNGLMYWTKTYSDNKKLTSFQVNYYDRGKKDSTCMERVQYDPSYGDTTYYEIQYIDKKGVKWYKQYSYYSRYYYGNPSQKKSHLMTVRTMRFFTKQDTKNFNDASWRKPETFDSAGYAYTYEQCGMYIEYAQDGKIRTHGRNAHYEYRVSHKGIYPSWPATGKAGVWRYYNNDVLYREEMYDDNTVLNESNQYYADGKLQGKYNYKRLGSQLRLPKSPGIVIAPNDTFKIQQSLYSMEGKLVSEVIQTPKNDRINVAYHPNGKPAYIQAHTAQNKPYGVHRKWDEKGHVTEYINYNVVNIDTLCYVAENGSITKLNLRDRSVPMNWEVMPVDYYGTEAKKHLYNQCVKYKEFYRNGKIKCEANLLKGKRNGEYLEWDSLGSQTLRAIYRNDIPDGQWNEWYPNGRPKRMLNFKNGIREGACGEYYPSGSVKWENTYVNGVPGTPKAYTENGTVLSSKNYISAFFAPSCVKEQVKSMQTIALHYYLVDTSVSRDYVTLRDTVLGDYGMKMVAAKQAINRNFDMCAPAEAVTNDNNEFDLYHSCFAISKSLFTEPNKAKINAFFARHGIKMDKSKVSNNPVLGLETEYLVYYSSTQILNKQLIIDSLEFYLAPRAIDAKQGYLMSVDLNFPAGDLFSGGSKTEITSNKGYSVVTSESKLSLSVYPYGQVTKTDHYIVYDDMTSDYQYTSTSVPMLTYWALK